MNSYFTHDLARARHIELLQEAELHRLAKQARQGDRGRRASHDSPRARAAVNRALRKARLIVAASRLSVATRGLLGDERS